MVDIMIQISKGSLEINEDVIWVATGQCEKTSDNIERKEKRKFIYGTGQNAYLIG